MNDQPSKCSFPHAKGIDRAEMPERIRKLPVLRGFPVPWFVGKVGGEFDFRLADQGKVVAAACERLKPLLPES